MCSRYFLDADGNVIAYTFRVPVDDRVRRRYNIAPTQSAAAPACASARESQALAWCPRGAGTAAVEDDQRAPEACVEARLRAASARHARPATASRNGRARPAASSLRDQLPDRRCSPSPVSGRRGIRWGRAPRPSPSPRIPTPRRQVHDRMPVILPDAEETGSRRDCARAAWPPRSSAGCAVNARRSWLAADLEERGPGKPPCAGSDPGWQGELI
jgi:hypothetical protein